MMIERITARQILDSRGQPTLEVRVQLETGDVGVAAVPAGASTGSHEAHELRDGEAAYGGRGVLKAIDNVNGPINKLLQGRDVRQQQELDQAMITADGTVNKSLLGGNAMIGVSTALAQAHAVLTRQPLYKLLRTVFDIEPRPKHRPALMMNILNGGLHADNGLKVQEFLIIPSGRTAAQMVERGAAVYQTLRALLKERGLSSMVGDEGGFTPTLSSETEAMDLIVEAIHRAELKLGRDVSLGLDFASSTFYDAGKQRYMLGAEHGLSPTGMMGMIDDWRKKYPLRTIEDPLAEDDWENWATLTAKFRSDLTIIGDDIFCTSAERLDRGINSQAASGIIIKPNQVGTLTETMQTVERARQAGYAIIASHRSGETMDVSIADLAVAIGADYLKAGAPARGERVAKYNRYMAIDSEPA